MWKTFFCFGMSREHYERNKALKKYGYSFNWSHVYNAKILHHDSSNYHNQHSRIVNSIFFRHRVVKCTEKSHESLFNDQY